MGAKVATFEQCYNAEKRRRLLCKYVKMDVWTLDVWTLRRKFRNSEFSFYRDRLI